MSRAQIIRLAIACFVLLVLGLPIPSSAAEPAALPGGFGLSAEYPGDAGIARDPAVLLAEDFEDGTIAELKKRWSDVSNKDGKVLALSEDVPAGGHGKRSIQMTSTLGQDTGGHLYTRLPRGVDKVFARFYVKFPEDAAYVHHFVHLGGYNPSTPWAQGGAGERPRGDERITVGIEPHGGNGRYAAPGAWTFYTYWQDMKISADGRYWGNALQGTRPAIIPRNRWQCVEVMLQLNSTPDASDGQLALWIDGKLQSHFFKGAKRGPWTGLGFRLLDEGGEPFEGFRFRKSNDLKINFFWLLFYVTENAGRQNRVANPPVNNRVWFDDIVVATEYVGPLRPAQAAAAVSPATGPSSVPRDAAERKKLAGLWKGFTVEGKGENPDRGPVKLELTITEQTMGGIEIKGTQRVDHGQGEYTLDLTTDPPQLDASKQVGPNRRQAYIGIYRIEGDTLKWCVSPQKVRPTTFETKKGQYLIILKRDKSAGAAPR